MTVLYGDIQIEFEPYVVEQLAVQKKTSHGDIQIEFEPYVVEQLAVQKKTSHGDMQTVFEPFIVEQLAVQKKTSHGDVFSFNLGMDISLDDFAPPTFIEKPSGIEKAKKSIFYLLKDALLQEDKIVNDDYFSDPLNWSKVILWYESDLIPGQKRLVTFNTSQDNPSGIFFISDKSVGNFRVQRVIIKDHDNGYIFFARDELAPSYLDIIFE